MCVCVYVVRVFYVYYMDYYHGYSILGFPGQSEHLMCAFLTALLSLMSLAYFR